MFGGILQDSIGELVAIDLEQLALLITEERGAVVDGPYALDVIGAEQRERYRHVIIVYQLQPSGIAFGGLQDD